MNFLILGDGPEEHSWARALADDAGHRIVMTCPGLKEWPGLPATNDLDAALGAAGLDAAIIGGEPELRSEGLRRAAGAGLAIVVLHPPGPNADPYYQVALSGLEADAVIVCDAPARLHPAVATLEKAAAEGPGRTVRYERMVGQAEGDLLGVVFPKVVDVVSILIGEIQAVTATGDPQGERPSGSLVVQLRGAGGRRGEVRLQAGLDEPARLIVAGPEGSIAWEHDADFLGPSRLVRRRASEAETIVEIPPWDPKLAILHSLAETRAGRDRGPNLTDGTRAMEVAEATARSLRRKRTIDLLHEEMSELGNFKSVMTSVGCGLLLIVPLFLLLAAAGRGLGLDWAVYLGWLVPPMLVGFVLLQFLRLGLKAPGKRSESAEP